MKNIHRRDFLKLGFLSSAVFLMSGCELLGVTTPKETIRLLQRDLFPQADDLNIDVAEYMDIIFAHSRITHEEKNMLKNGVKLLNEAALSEYAKRYTQLAKMQREKLLGSVVQTQWGENFFDAVLRYTLEATLGDPIYKGNKNQTAWKWLNFEAPNPQAKKAYL